jgi:RNA recognition motif-containing protein
MEQMILMETNRLLIKNLDSLTTEAHIENLFSIYGDVNRIRVNRERGRGFVEMTSAGEARRVHDKLDGAVLWGRSMEINRMNDTIRHRLIYLFSRIFM